MGNWPYQWSALSKPKMKTLLDCRKRRLSDDSFITFAQRGSGGTLICH